MCLNLKEMKFHFFGSKIFLRDQGNFEHNSRYFRDEMNRHYRNDSEVLREFRIVQ